MAQTAPAEPAAPPKSLLARIVGQKLADFLAKKKVKVSDKARPAIDTAEMNDVFVRLLRGATSGRNSDEVYEQALAEVKTLAERERLRRQLAALSPEEREQVLTALREQQEAAA